MKVKWLIAALMISFVSFGQGSYIARLWNTKSYDKIIEFSPKGNTLSGRDNMLVGRAFMALTPAKAKEALEHYDLAISKRLNSEDLYYFRAEANYELGQLNDALGDLNKCLEFRENFQKYLLFKAAIEYELGRKDDAYNTYFTLSELYDKQTPFYMLAVINIEREKYYKARQQVDDNLLRFERGEDFWRMTAEQQVELEWRIFKDYNKALSTQNALLNYKPNNINYLINKLVLERIQGLDSIGQLSENDLQNRYNTNELPLSYYKKGSIKVAEQIRPNGVIEDYRTFRPGLFENVKYSRFYISDLGNIVGKHTAGLVVDPRDSTARLWDFRRGDQRFFTPAVDTNYAGFNALFELPDSAFIPRSNVVISDSTQLEQTFDQTDSTAAPVMIPLSPADRVKELRPTDEGRIDEDGNQLEVKK